MLSIIIPTYNYNTVPLVTELQKQCKSEGIVFEIIVFDDASTDERTILLNQKINSLSECYYQLNPHNLGRSENRNALIKKSIYDWILLLDSDTFPKNTSFIKDYLAAIQQNTKAIFGGLAYKEEKPKKDEILRWEYGRKREAINLKSRIENPYESSLVSNILLKKEILPEELFNVQIRDYGFEDMVFINELKRNNTAILQIENPVFHLNLEKSITFLNKYNSSLKNLKYLLEHKVIDVNDTRLTKWYYSLKKWKLLFLVSFIFRISKKQLIRNLVSNKPSLYLFDFYKLGYFCNLINN